MKVLTAKVVDGRIDVGSDVKDGTTVAVLAPGVQGFQLTPAEENELAEALQQVREGEFVDGRALVAELRGLAKP